MHDSYIDFANSPVGSRITALLGLPAPLPLERYRADQPVIKGTVLLGAGSKPQLLETLAAAFQAMGAQTLAHRTLPQWTAVANQAGLMTGRWGVEDKPGEKVKALVFDATGMDDSASLRRCTSFSTTPRVPFSPVAASSSSAPARVVHRTASGHCAARTRRSCSAHWPKNSSVPSP
jgi:hypothetical protein